jgi:hypothetical protein
LQIIIGHMGEATSFMLPRFDATLTPGGAPRACALACQSSGHATLRPAVAVVITIRFQRARSAGVG